MRRASLRPRPPQARRGAAAVLVALALGGAGCGGQAQQVRDAGVYTERINRVQRGFERDLQGVVGSLQGVLGSADRRDRRRDVSATVSRLADRVDEVRRELEDIGPPRVATQAHRALITAYGGWQAPLDAFRRALSDRSRSATRRAAATFLSSIAQVERQRTAAGRRINDRLRSLSD